MPNGPSSSSDTTVTAPWKPASLGTKPLMNGSSAGAANIIHRKEINAAKKPEAVRKKKVAEYEELFSNPYVAASRGFVDAVIYPRETRPRLIDALSVLISKRESRPPKKHGNIPT